MISTTSDKDITMKDMDMKEKLASKIIPKVGDEVVGFKFDSCDGHDVKWDSDMEDYIGERGVVLFVMEDKGWFLVEFQDVRWIYPLKLAHLAYEQKEPTIEELLKEIKETKAILESIAEEQKQKEQVLIALKEELKKRGVVMVEDVAAEKSEDMSNPRNWKKGDMVVCTDDSTFSDSFIEGEIYTLREDCDGRIARVVADSSGIENGWGVQFFKFHSSPN